MSENNEVFEKLEKLASDLPKGFKENATALVERMQAVIEGIGDNPIHWKPSFLRVIQGTTTEIPEGASVGHIAIGDVGYGKSLDVIPLRNWASRQMWDPDPNNAKILCSSPDGKQGTKYGKCYGCPQAEWIDGQGTACTKNMNFLAVAADLSDVFIVSFSKSAYKNGLEWQGLLRKAGVSPFTRSYTLSTAPNPKRKQIHLLGAAPSAESKVTDKKVLAFLEALFINAGEGRNQELKRHYDYLEYKESQEPKVLENQSDEASQEVLPGPSKEGEADEGGEGANYVL